MNFGFELLEYARTRFTSDKTLIQLQLKTNSKKDQTQHT